MDTITTDALIRAINALGEPGTLDILDFILTLLLSVAAVVVSVIIARRESKITLLEQRYEGMSHINDLISLCRILETQVKNNQKIVNELKTRFATSPDTPVTYATSVTPTLSFQFKLLSLFLFHTSFELTPETAETPKTPTLETLPPTLPPGISAGQPPYSTRSNRLKEACKLSTTWISGEDIRFSKTTAISSETILIHWRAFECQINQSMILFKKVKPEEVQKLLKACEQYIVALVAMHHAYERTMLIPPERTPEQRSNVWSLRDNTWVPDAYFNYLAWHPSTISYEDGTKQGENDSKRLAALGEALQTKLLALIQQCQNFETAQFPIMKNYLPL